MSYARALAKLEALPADEQELASGRYVFEVRDGKPHCGCAIGKLLTEEQRLDIVSYGPNASGVTKLFSHLRIHDDGDLFGMNWEDSRLLQALNDRIFDVDNSNGVRKERYRLVIAWLREQVAKETK